MPSRRFSGIGEFGTIVKAKVDMIFKDADVTEMLRHLFGSYTETNVFLFWPGHFDNVGHDFLNQRSGACRQLLYRWDDFPSSEFASLRELLADALARQAKRAVRRSRTKAPSGRCWRTP